ncbi:hypothetical protein [Hymenobacter coccineus]|uniref:Addiction module protein n=1 Tax=Hymenobacter coccineus TaxID=1908235 RepID=A0A1G1TIH0_9BACT|nr:hypothetical protein [Hymenobacter coccineus]OGX90666.1 hypothetical protein BEN49_06335 [Hymenobacter coccineus]
MTHEAVIETVKTLPVNFELNELVERLILLEDLDKRRQQGQRGETISFEEMKREASTWQK